MLTDEILNLLSKRTGKKITLGINEVLVDGKPLKIKWSAENSNDIITPSNTEQFVIDSIVNIINESFSEKES